MAAPQSIEVPLDLIPVPDGNRITVDDEYEGAFSAQGADVNGDGYVDIIAVSMFHGIAWWENVDGTGLQWIKHVIEEDFDGPRSAFATDLNNDGYIDVVAVSWTADGIAWWENENGSGLRWIEHTIEDSFDGSRSVHAADLNGDSYLDVLAASWDIDEIAWWENPGGNGLSWEKRLIKSDFREASSIHATDIDGDEYIDVLGIAHLDDEISWWQNVDGNGTESSIDGAGDPNPLSGTSSIKYKSLLLVTSATKKKVSPSPSASSEKFLVRYILRATTSLFPIGISTTNPYFKTAGGGVCHSTVLENSLNGLSEPELDTKVILYRYLFKASSVSIPIPLSLKSTCVMVPLGS